jgi:hypothetical protein
MADWCAVQDRFEAAAKGLDLPGSLIFADRDQANEVLASQWGLSPRRQRQQRALGNSAILALLKRP